MARRESGDEALEAKLEDLQSHSRTELQQAWLRLYGTDCPPRMSRTFLMRGVAYRLQEEALGGLDRATRRRLDRAVENLDNGRVPKRAPTKIKPGTRLLREWQGVVHEVVVLENGVAYRGETWPSLSAVAREITGARWSGPRFFGLTGASSGRG